MRERWMDGEMNGEVDGWQRRVERRMWDGWRDKFLNDGWRGCMERMNGEKGRWMERTVGYGETNEWLERMMDGFKEKRD